MNKRLLCFNVNGIRARLHQLESVIARHRPEIIGLQETKVDDPEFPIDAVNALGYHVEYHGQKGHYGVALLSRTPPTEVHRGFPSDEVDAQRRFIHGCYCLEGVNVHVLNGYFPQGEGRDHPTKFPAKERYYRDLYDYIDTHFKEGDHLVGGRRLFSHEPRGLGREPSSLEHELLLRPEGVLLVELERERGDGATVARLLRAGAAVDAASLTGSTPRVRVEEKVAGLPSYTGSYTPAATGDADVLAPLPAPQDELRRSDEYEESFEEGTK